MTTIVSSRKKKCRADWKNNQSINALQSLTLSVRIEKERDRETIVQPPPADVWGTGGGWLEFEMGRTREEAVGRRETRLFIDASSHPPRGRTDEHRRRTLPLQQCRSSTTASADGAG
uniref:Uncharacterized protein n=1 Tax=Globodera rostochiensis TaxID=31243 RepID=A0A914HG88_GLORO